MSKISKLIFKLKKITCSTNLNLNFSILINLIPFNFKNDLTTTVFMYLVASKNEKIDLSKLDPIYLDEWFSQYIGKKNRVYSSLNSKTF